MTRLLIAAALLVSTVTLAHAQAPSETELVAPAPAPAPKEDGLRTGLTIQPIYLVLTMIDLTLEQQIAPHVTVAGTVGYGKLFLGAVTLWDLGAQANFYLRRNATGWHAGAQARYFSVSLADWLKTEEDQMDDDGRQRVLGGYVGYSWVSDRGFTIVSQLGLAHMKMTGTSEGPKSQLFPIANFSLGWSI